MQKFLFISLLFIGFSTFFANDAAAQNTVRLQSEASVTFEGIYVLYNNGWGANILEESSEYYLMSGNSFDIALSSGGTWTIRLWDTENTYIFTVDVDEYDDITYVAITDDLLRRSVSN